MDIIGFKQSSAAHAANQKQLPPTPELIQLEEVQSLHSFKKIAGKTDNIGLMKGCNTRSTRNMKGFFSKNIALQDDQTGKILTRRMQNSKLEKLAFSQFNGHGLAANRRRSRSTQRYLQTEA